MPRSKGAPRSPRAPRPTPANSENTTICKISLLASASKIERGTRWVMKVFNAKSPVATTVGVAAVGSASSRPTPGRISCTMTIPRTSDMRLAPMNHRIVRVPMRPNEVLLPMCATPATSVENTSGAMIIRIKRRKMSVTTENESASAAARSAVSVD